MPKPSNMGEKDIARDEPQQNYSFRRPSYAPETRHQQSIAGYRYVEGDVDVPRSPAPINMETSFSSIESDPDHLNYTYLSSTRGNLEELQQTRMAPSFNRNAITYSQAGEGADEPGQTTIAPINSSRGDVTGYTRSLTLTSNHNSDSQLVNHSTVVAKYGESGTSRSPVDDHRDNGIVFVSRAQTRNGRYQTEVWCLPGLSLSHVRATLAQYGLREAFVSCANGLGQDVTAWSAPSQKVESSANTYTGLGNLPTSANEDCSEQTGDMSMALAEVLVTSPILCFACPMTKHDRHRYTNVVTPCTLPKGFKEFRRVKEHMQNYHSTKSGCPYCKVKWQDSLSSTDEFQRHFDICHKVREEGIMTLPEWLDQKQMKALDHDYRGTAGDLAWTHLYKNLFPGEIVPDPYYDYYTMPHLLRDGHGTSWQVLIPEAPHVASPHIQRPYPGLSSVPDHNIPSYTVVHPLNDATREPIPFLDNHFLNDDLFHLPTSLTVPQNQEFDYIPETQTRTTRYHGHESSVDSGYHSSRWSSEGSHSRDGSAGSSNNHTGPGPHSRSFHNHETTQPLLPTIEESEDITTYRPGPNETGDDLLQQFIHQRWL